MTSTPQWTDWVTALATGLTAIAAVITGIIAYLAYLRDTRRDLAHVETYIRWAQDDKLGSHLVLKIKALNISYESLTLASCKIDKPRGTKLSIGVNPSTPMDELVAAVGEGSEVQLGYDLKPEGSTGFMGRGRGDVLWIKLYAFPPDAWKGGKLRLTITLSNSSDLPWTRKFVTKRRIVGRPLSPTPAAL